MGTIVTVQSHQEMYRSNPVQPVILNDLKNITEEEKKAVDRLISSQFESDLLSNEPSCECGEIKGGFNIGVFCHNCRTTVQEMYEKDLVPIVWMRSPNGVEKLISPLLLIMLTDEFVAEGFNLIEWLINTKYSPNVNKPPEVDQLLEAGVLRGYNNFVQNFDQYIEILFSLRRFRAKKGEEGDLLTLIKLQKDKLFSNFIPLVNKSLLVIENTEVGIWVDASVVDAVDAIRTITGIDTPYCTFSVREKENRTARTLLMLSEYYVSVIHEQLSPKAGLFRKNIYGGRNNFSMRCVISSLTDPHAYDELELPWAPTIAMLKLHLINKMLNSDKYNFTPNSATARMYQATYEYDPLIDELMQELINESQGSHLTVMLNRNPSLTRGSVQSFKIWKIKKNPADFTIGLPIITVKKFNADFDGDALNLVLSIDNETTKGLENLAPHKNIYDLNNPRSLSSAASLPKTISSTIANWYTKVDEVPITPEQQRFYEML